MTKFNDTILALSTLHTAVKEQHHKHIGLCAIGEDGVHVLESMFVELFSDKKQLVNCKDRGCKQYPFEYATHVFGTKFYTVSENPNLMSKYPVEDLAEELLQQWERSDSRENLRVIYFKGVYALEYIPASFVDVGAEIIYTFKQLESAESVTLEQAILDHMEVTYNDSL